MMYKMQISIGAIEIFGCDNFTKIAIIVKE